MSHTHRHHLQTGAPAVHSEAVPSLYQVVVSGGTVCDGPERSCALTPTAIPRVS